ncbi:caspase family protein [Pirellulaceae bacterium SH449]
MLRSLTLSVWIGLTFAATSLGYGFAIRASDESKDVQRYALLIGVGEYENPELNPLPGSEADVLELGRLFSANGFAPSHLVLMTQKTGSQDERLLPNAQNIRFQLSKVLADKSADDVVVIAFAGHGIQAASDVRENESYFCPSDAKPRDLTSLISLADVFQSFSTSGSHNKILLVDACREDQASVNRLMSEIKPSPEPPENTAVFMSCSPGQFAYERESALATHGVFFHSVIRGLEGAAAGADGGVTLQDLERFVTKDVETFVWKAYGAKQQPALRNRISGPVQILPTSLADREVKRAFDFWIRGQILQAERVLEQLLTRWPNNASVLAEKARILSERGESRHTPSLVQDAYEIALRAVAAEPTNPATHLALSNVLRIQEKLPEAFESCQRAIELDPYDPLGYAYRAMLNKTMGRDREVLVDVDLLIERRSTHPLCMGFLASLQFAKEDFADGFQTVEQGLSIYPDVPMFHFLKGYGLDQVGDYNKAILSYTAAIRLDNQDDETYLRRAVSLFRVGDSLAAAEDFQKAAQLNPARPDLPSIREFLSKPANANAKRPVSKTQITRSEPTQRWERMIVSP